MKMTTEEAFVKTLQRHGIDTLWHHRVGHDADLGSVSAGGNHVLGLRA